MWLISGGSLKLSLICKKWEWEILVVGLRSNGGRALEVAAVQGHWKLVQWKQVGAVEAIGAVQASWCLQCKCTANCCSANALQTAAVQRMTLTPTVRLVTIRFFSHSALSVWLIRGGSLPKLSLFQRLLSHHLFGRYSRLQELLNPSR